MDWASAPEQRDQMVLFATRLEDAIPRDHHVRLLDEILSRLDWSVWESDYDLRRGQPPIHPRILASVILYGVLSRIRSSRGLEEALQVRLDFRWLVEGRSIDHTTLCKFRRKNAEALKNTFVQIAMVARQMGYLPLQALAFDGTRMQANNRRFGTRSREELLEMKQELAQRFAELEARSAAADDVEDEQFGSQTGQALPGELKDVERRRQQVDAALTELEQLEEAGETVPGRVPIIDPQSRVMQNKEGGFAPNYTPLATADVDSGLMVGADVISNPNENRSLVGAMEEVQEQFGLERPVPEVLADGLMATGDNLAACEAMGVDLYAPLAGPSADNPALRDDPTQPVAAADRERLPTKTMSGKPQLQKQAFVYDEDRDCYWCPEGKPLKYSHTSTEKRSGGSRERRNYKASEEDCAGCPLRDLCIRGKAKSRKVVSEKHEARRAAHAEKMATDEAQAKYERRRHCGERPFAVIKHQFTARQFLLRGLDRVKQEWNWLAIAFNLTRLMSLIRSGPGPPGDQLSVA